jgi:Ca2+/Na+ antiporter
MDTAKLFSAVAGTALCIGLLFDAGYFLSFDINYFMLLSYKDHLSVLALFAVPCLFVAFLFLVVRTGRPNQSKSASESHKFDIAMGCWIALVLFLSVMPLTTSSFPFPAVIKFAFWFKGLSSFFLLAYLTAAILGAFLTRKGSDQVGVGLGLAFFSLPCMILIFGGYVYRASVINRQFDTEVTLAPDGKTAGRPQSAHIVRAIDRGFFLVLQDAPDRVIFVKSDSVVMLSKNVGR